ncbi:oligopeptide/dipeptide ABC transporter ATP-binding protein, partial [Inquilinus sp.]|uniref:oligopeptide/dipeptide ABC transporter ATP-binding protein n=1 Tax=Inquilinus sp. TaxID=1932117 RepID=UPI0031E179EF
GEGGQQLHFGLSLALNIQRLDLSHVNGDPNDPMYAGRIVETGPVREVFRHPRHPYTIGLLASVPKLGEATRLKAAGEKLATIPGTVPSLAAMPPGCAFASRCAYAVEACRAAVPAPAEVSPGHTSRCIRWQEL